MCVQGVGSRGERSLSNLFAHNCLFLSRKSLKQTYRERSAPPARRGGEPLLPSARRAAQSNREPPSTGGARSGVRELAGAGDPAGGDSVQPSALPRVPQPEVPDSCLQPASPWSRGGLEGSDLSLAGAVASSVQDFFYLNTRHACPTLLSWIRPRTRRPNQHVALGGSGQRWRGRGRVVWVLVKGFLSSTLATVGSGALWPHLLGDAVSWAPLRSWPFVQSLFSLSCPSLALDPTPEAFDCLPVSWFCHVNVNVLRTANWIEGRPAT